jgi:hypothetical protein
MPRQTVKPRGSGTSARYSRAAPQSRVAPPPDIARPSFPRPSVGAALGSSRPWASSSVSSALRSGAKKPPRTTPHSSLPPAASAWSNPSTRPKLLKNLVRVKGLEPPLPFGKQILSLPRLPFRHTRLCAPAGVPRIAFSPRPVTRQAAARATRRHSRRSNQNTTRPHRARFPLASAREARIYRCVDALARAYGPWWLCNDVTRPFWQPGPPARWEGTGPEREVDMVAIPSRAIAPCPDPDAVLRGTRQRGRGGRVSDPSSLS